MRGIPDENRRMREDLCAVFQADHGRLPGALPGAAETRLRHLPQVDVRAGEMTICHRETTVRHEGDLRGWKQGQSPRLLIAGLAGNGGSGRRRRARI